MDAAFSATLNALVSFTSFHASKDLSEVGAVSSQGKV